MLVLLLGCAALEVVARVRFYMQHGTFQRVHTFATDPASGIPIPPPGRVTGTVRIDSRGLRSPEIDVPKPSGRLRVVFVGASTTFCAEASSNEATWPALVVAAVRAAHPGLDLDWANAAVAGHVLDQMLLNLEHRVKPLAPDVIVLYEATNDLTRETRAQAQAQGVYREHSDASGGLSDWSLAWHLVEKNLLVRARAEEAAQGAGRLALDEAALAEAFRAKLGPVVARAREIAPCVAIATFAQRARAGQGAQEQIAACVTHFYYMPYMSHDALVRGFAACNRVIREVAAAHGAILIEGEELVPADAAHFADSVHFTDAGCRWQAERVVRGLEADARFQALIREGAAQAPGR